MSALPEYRSGTALPCWDDPAKPNDLFLCNPKNAIIVLFSFPSHLKPGQVPGFFFAAKARRISQKICGDISPIHRARLSGVGRANNGHRNSCSSAVARRFGVEKNDKAGGEMRMVVFNAKIRARGVGWSTPYPDADWGRNEDAEVFL